MLQAGLAKLRSNCIARKVGAVIAKNHRQLATGYNGTPPGIKNCYEGGCERCWDRVNGLLLSGEALERCMCTHAEANAIIHCAILGIGTVNGATLYSTATPCLDCTKMAITIGIERFVCVSEYPERTQDLVDSAKIEVVLMDAARISRWINGLEIGDGD
jgi:dCMP deaminase